jgi:hypothetical protein
LWKHEDDIKYAKDLIKKRELVRKMMQLGVRHSMLERKKYEDKIATLE